jgi:hypothetical protein
MLTLSLTAGRPTQLQQMLDGVIAVLTEDNAAALPQLGGETGVLTQLDEPVVNTISPGIRSQLDLPLRVALALRPGWGWPCWPTTSTRPSATGPKWPARVAHHRRDPQGEEKMIQVPGSQVPGNFIPLCPCPCNLGFPQEELWN